MREHRKWSKAVRRKLRKAASEYSMEKRSGGREFEKYIFNISASGETKTIHLQRDWHSSPSTRRYRHYAAVDLNKQLRAQGSDFEEIGIKDLFSFLTADDVRDTDPMRRLLEVMENFALEEPFDHGFAPSSMFFLRKQMIDHIPIDIEHTVSDVPVELFTLEGHHDVLHVLFHIDSCLDQPIPNWINQFTYGQVLALPDYIEELYADISAYVCDFGWDSDLREKSPSLEKAWQNIRSLWREAICDALPEEKYEELHKGLENYAGTRALAI